MCLATLVSASATTKYAAVSITGGGRRSTCASTVTGDRRARPSASTAAASPRSASTGGAIPRARSRSSAIAALASPRAWRTSSATSGWSASRVLGAAELHAERDEPRLRAVVQVALDPPQLGGLDVERAAPGARELVDALDELLLAHPREPVAEHEQRVSAASPTDMPRTGHTGHR